LFSQSSTTAAKPLLETQDYQHRCLHAHGSISEVANLTTIVGSFEGSETTIRVVEINHTQRTKKRRENARFNKIQQFAYILRAEGREILLNKSPIQVVNKGTPPSIYSQRIHEENETNNSKIGSETKLKNF